MIEARRMVCGLSVAIAVVSSSLFSQTSQGGIDPGTGAVGLMERHAPARAVPLKNLLTFDSRTDLERNQARQQLFARVRHRLALAKSKHVLTAQYGGK